MTDEKKPLALSQKPAKLIIAEADARLTQYADSDFKPTESMLMARSRLQDWMRRHPPLPGTVDLAYIQKYSGSNYIEKWANANELFTFWILDVQYDEHKLSILRDLAISSLVATLKSDYIEKVLTEKDKIKAAEILLNLTGSFPSAKKEVKYLDEGVNRMSDADVQRDLAKARKDILGE